MSWPSGSDYSDLIQSPALCFGDGDLRTGSVVTNMRGDPRVASGSFASVFEIQTTQRKWAVRCFTRQPPSGQEEHYGELTRHLTALRLPMLAEFHHLQRGILVRGRWFPVVKMEYVEGEPLNVFVGGAVRRDPTFLDKLAGRWRSMIADLAKHRIAHGDLQHGNVLITEQGEFKLVDYDAMFVPSRAGRTCPEFGHRHFQHPGRQAKHYDAQLDHFSALVIYTSLRALASDPSLWSLSEDENLIFKATDFQQPDNSEAFQRLKSNQKAEVRSVGIALRDCCIGKPERVPALEHILSNLPKPGPVEITTQGKSQGAAPKDEWWKDQIGVQKTHQKPTGRNTNRPKKSRPGGSQNFPQGPTTPWWPLPPPTPPTPPPSPAPLWKAILDWLLCEPASPPASAAPAFWTWGALAAVLFGLYNYSDANSVDVVHRGPRSAYGAMIFSGLGLFGVIMGIRKTRATRSSLTWFMLVPFLLALLLGRSGWLGSERCNAYAAEARKATENRINDDAKAKAEAEAKMELAARKAAEAFAIAAMEAETKAKADAKAEADAKRLAEAKELAAKRKAESDAKAAMETKAKAEVMAKVFLASFGNPTKDQPWENTLNMKFVPVTGTEVLFSIWATRAQDYQIFTSSTGRRWVKPTFTQGPTHPAVNVDWQDAQAFCQWLTQKERGEGKLAAGQIYRLPQDWEWSVAAGLNEVRAGTPKEKDRKIKDVYPWGKQWPPPRGAGNYDQRLNVDDYPNTSPVGSFEANAFGLYDLGGNMWQWCEDWYDSNQRFRVLRGGAWDGYSAEYLLSSYRLSRTTDDRCDYYGFRLVLAQ